MSEYVLAYSCHILPSHLLLSPSPLGLIGGFGEVRLCQSTYPRGEYKMPVSPHGSGADTSNENSLPGLSEVPATDDLLLVSMLQHVLLDLVKCPVNWSAEFCGSDHWLWLPSWSTLKFFIHPVNA